MPISLVLIEPSSLQQPPPTQRVSQNPITGGVDARQKRYAGYDKAAAAAGLNSREDVKALQQKLINANYLEEGGADGLFGRKTADAFKRWTEAQNGTGKTEITTSATSGSQSTGSNTSTETSSENSSGSTSSTEKAPVRTRQVITVPPGTDVTGMRDYILPHIRPNQYRIGVEQARAQRDDIIRRNLGQPIRSGVYEDPFDENRYYVRTNGSPTQNSIMINGSPYESRAAYNSVPTSVSRARWIRNQRMSQLEQMAAERQRLASQAAMPYEISKQFQAPTPAHYVTALE